MPVKTQCQCQHQMMLQLRHQQVAESHQQGPVSEQLVVLGLLHQWHTLLSLCSNLFQPF